MTLPALSLPQSPLQRLLQAVSRHSHGILLGSASAFAVPAAERRSERLSWAMWPLVGTLGVPILQPARRFSIRPSGRIIRQLRGVTAL